MNMHDTIYRAVGNHPTPFYLYDLTLLDKTLEAVRTAASTNPKFKVHYAMKARYTSHGPILE